MNTNYLKLFAISAVIMNFFMVSSAIAQEKPVNDLIKNISGTVTGSDSVGNIISIRTQDQKQMVFSVPDKAIITQETHNIGLMDIRDASAVTIQYFITPSFQNTVVSIVDNSRMVNE